MSEVRYKKKKTPERGVWSGDQGETLLHEPLLGFLHAALRAVLEQLVVAPDGTVAIVDLDKPPVRGASVDVLGQGEQDFHVELRKGTQRKTPAKAGWGSHREMTTDMVTGTCLFSLMIM